METLILMDVEFVMIIFMMIVLKIVQVLGVVMHLKISAEYVMEMDYHVLQI